MSALPIKPSAPAVSIAARRRAGIGLGLIAAAGAAALVAPHMRAPDLDLLRAQPTVLQVHIAAAFTVLILGTALMLLRKGGTLHRALGWTWAVLMTVTAGSSLFIVGLAGDHWSWIHLLSGLTLVSLPLGLMAARRGDIKRHRRTMMGIFYGGSLIAGAFTFVPGRLMWRVVMG